MNRPFRERFKKQFTHTANRLNNKPTPNRTKHPHLPRGSLGAAAPGGGQPERTSHTVQTGPL